MKRYNLFIHVARILISWKASHTLVVWSITMVSHVKKSYGGLSWPCPAWLMVSWTHSAQVSGMRLNQVPLPA